jgi:hypothetical protein
MNYFDFVIIFGLNQPTDMIQLLFSLQQQQQQQQHHQPSSNRKTSTQDYLIGNNQAEGTTHPHFFLIHFERMPQNSII